MAAWFCQAASSFAQVIKYYFSLFKLSDTEIHRRRDWVWKPVRDTLLDSRKYKHSVHREMLTSYFFPSSSFLKRSFIHSA